MSMDEVKAMKKQIIALNKESAEIMKEVKQLFKNGKQDQGLELIERSKEINDEAMSLGFDVLEKIGKK